MGRGGGGDALRVRPCGAKAFREYCAYLSKYRQRLDYARYQRRGLAIGSGVTEAACKTIIGYRFKQSGMRWKREDGQHILNLRILLKSGSGPTPISDA